MTDYRIVCKNLSDDESRILRVGLIKPGGNPKKADFSATPKKVNDMIGNGDRCFFTIEGGKETEVEQFGDDFIRTKADGTVKNNLRHLRNCNPFS